MTREGAAQCQAYRLFADLGAVAGKLAGQRFATAVALRPGKADRAYRLFVAAASPGAMPVMATAQSPRLFFSAP